MTIIVRANNYKGRGCIPWILSSMRVSEYKRTRENSIEGARGERESLRDKRRKDEREGREGIMETSIAR